MQSRARVFGHPIHQILVAFPLGLFGSGATCDLIGMVRGGGPWSLVALYMVGGGVIGGLAASLFGFIDYLGIPSGTRAKRVGRIHGMSSVAVVALFGCSWYLRLDGSASVSPLALAFSFGGALLACVAGWFGGELVSRMGVGIDDGAHLDATGASLAAAPRLATRQESRAAG